MKLLIRNKWFSIFKQSSEVKDETGEKDVMVIEGKFWTFTAKKFIKDMDGNVHYMVRNKFWRIFTRKALIYDAEGNKIATVRRKIFSLHDRYFIEDCTIGNMEIMGNIFQFDYNITLDGKQVGHIMRRVSLRDSFVLEFSNNLEPELMVACLVRKHSRQLLSNQNIDNWLRRQSRLDDS